jgi:hypothetical protein
MQARLTNESSDVSGLADGWPDDLPTGAIRTPRGHRIAEEHVRDGSRPALGTHVFARVRLIGERFVDLGKPPVPPMADRESQHDHR